MEKLQDVSAVQAVGKKYIDAVTAFMNKNINKNELTGIQDEFEKALVDFDRIKLIEKLSGVSEKIQAELNTLESLSDKINDHNLLKAIINIEKSLEALGEISELYYVS